MIPVLQSHSSYKVKLPYTLDNKVYLCVGLRNLSSLISENKDPYTMYYSPVGVSKEEYMEGVIRDDIIVTLYNENHDIHHIPSWYFVDEQLPTVVPYVNMTIALNIGDIPSDTNLDTLITDLEQYVLDKVGINPISLLLSKELELPVTLEKHQALDFKRRMQINNSVSIFTKYRYLVDRYNAQLERIKLLESYIKHSLPTP